MKSCSLPFLLAVLIFQMANCFGEDAEQIAIPMESLFDWDDPLALDATKLQNVLGPIESKLNQRIYSDYTSPYFTSGSRIEAGDSSWVLTAFNGKYRLFGARFIFAPARSRRITLLIRVRDYEGAEADIAEKLTAATGDSSGRTVLRRFANPRTQVITEARFPVWYHANYFVEMANIEGSLNIHIATRSPEVDGMPRVSTPPKQLAADLDALLNFETLWQWSPEEFEKHYAVKLEDQTKQQKPPQFEWVSNRRERARFSRHMFSNVETKLTMFGGSINVEEAILEFVNGKAARVTVSFYNRGDSGDIEVADFDHKFKTIGRNLGQITKVSPKRQLMSANAALPVTSWMWRFPAGVVLLEYNEYNTPGKATQPEFLRMKLAAPNQADWSMGKLAVGVQRMELLKRITKTPSGDVYLSGVPMVDQGQKGYCVVASCQRLFEYMRIPCDQHEMAKLVNADAETGADISGMQKSLAKIDGAFNVTFKPLVNPEVYYSGNRKRRVSEKEYISIIKEYIGKGVPLLWGLVLGVKPEIPPLSRQTTGGHMRMIIGYNLAKNQVIFTDSWGAGHELKRMNLLDAYEVTMGLYSMAPRGL